MRIVISAGHYPAAPGAAFGDILEHKEATTWITAIRKRLVDRGAVVCVLRPGPLSEKIKEANAFRADLAMELHFNADAAHKGRGSETLYHPKSRLGKALAEEVQRSMSSLCAPNRGVKEGWYQMNVGGNIDAFLARTNCPAIIVEPLFVHETERFPVAREFVPVVIADALFEFCEENFHG